MRRIIDLTLPIEEHWRYGVTENEKREDLMDETSLFLTVQGT